MRNPAQAYENSSGSTDTTPKAQETSRKSLAAQAAVSAPLRASPCSYVSTAAGSGNTKLFPGDRAVLNVAQGICCSQV